VCSTAHALVPQSLFVQRTASPLVCVLLPMTFASRAIFLRACEPPPMTSVLCTIILHGREPLPTTSMSRVELIHEFKPPQATFELCVASPLALFLLRWPSEHHTEIAFTE
jgi:hypothetical protein